MMRGGYGCPYDERLETARTSLQGKYPEVAHKISEVQNAIWRIRQYAY